MNNFYNNFLDATGLLCPEPIMLIRKEIRQMQVGEILLVITDDNPSIKDVPDFCSFMNHKLINSQTENKPYQFWIKKQ